MCFFLEGRLEILFPRFKPGCFSGISFSRHVSWETQPFPTTVSLARLVQPWQQLNFSPCPAAQSDSSCQSSGEEEEEEEEGWWVWLCCWNRSLWLEAVNLRKLVLGLFNTGSEAFSSDLNPCCANSAGSNLLAFIYLFCLNRLTSRWWGFMLVWVSSSCSQWKAGRVSKFWLVQE